MIPFMGRPVRNAIPFTAIHVPAANTKATITQAAPGAGRRIIVTSITVGIAATGTAPAANVIQANLINGASGGSDVRWSARVGIQAVAGTHVSLTPSGWWEMDENTACTLEFASGGGANTDEFVSMSGIIVDVAPV